MVDDQLPSWDKVKGQFKEESGILIGNGASQAIWENLDINPFMTGRSLG